MLLALVRAMDAARIRTASDILFVGDVGEEGQGDLRGMRYLFQKGPYKDRIKTFISIDGTGEGRVITNGAVGSKRYRVTFKGPGGHSYGAFGLVSPVLAMGNAIQKISKISVPASPKRRSTSARSAAALQSTRFRELDGPRPAVRVACGALQTRQDRQRAPAGGRRGESHAVDRKAKSP